MGVHHNEIKKGGKIYGVVSKRRFKRKITLLILSGFLLTSIIFSTGIGCTFVSLNTVMAAIFNALTLGGNSANLQYTTVVIDVRLPRAVMGALVGGALAVSGCILQSMLRNPLASPYIIGVCSAAAFGASLAILFQAEIGSIPMLGVLYVPVFAFIFSIAAMFFVYYFSRVRGKISVEGLILIGVATMLLFSALTSILQYIAYEELRSIVVWLMGGLWQVSWKHVIIAFPGILLCVTITALFSRKLNLVAIGEETALSLGVDVEKLKKYLFVLVCLLTAFAVSFTGPIGFIGLIIPHIMRIFVGNDNTVLMPASFLGGAIFLVWMDVAARMLIAPAELPVGILTSLFGAPFFIYLWHKNKGRVLG